MNQFISKISFRRQLSSSSVNHVMRKGGEAALPAGSWRERDLEKGCGGICSFRRGGVKEF